MTKALSTRRDYYAVLKQALPEDAAVIAALGNASYLWAEMCDRPENFYFEDAMGLALPFALGVAAAQPDRPVVVVEGDGGLSMHLGALVTIGADRPKNLTILLIRNGVHAASGGQVLTNPDLDLAELARAVKIGNAHYVASADAFEKPLARALQSDGPHFLVLDCEADIEVVRPPKTHDPVEIKHRFGDAMGAQRYVPTMFGGGVR